MGETSLHDEVKRWYAQPGDRLEEWVDGYLIDIVRDDQLIEIQTGNFSAIKAKLENLVRRHPVRLVHPIAQTKWIVRLDARGGRVSRRRSPRRGRVEDLFLELVYIPHLMAGEAGRGDAGASTTDDSYTWSSDPPSRRQPISRSSSRRRCPRSSRQGSLLSY